MEIVTISPHFIAESRASLEQSYTSIATEESSGRARSSSGGGGGASKVPLELSAATSQEPPIKRVNKVSAGGAFGEADFFLGRNHWCDMSYPGFSSHT